MTGRFITEGEREQLRRIGETFLEALKPILLAEGRDPAAADDFTCYLVEEAVGAIFTALRAHEPAPNLCAIFTGIGLQLGRAYGQQEEGFQLYLDDALERALGVGMRQAAEMGGPEAAAARGRRADA